MRILHISKYYYPYIGGVEQVAKDIVDSLKDVNGVQQKVICFNETMEGNGQTYDGKKDCIDYVDDIEVVRCGYFTKISSQSLSMSYAKNLKNMMENFIPDVVIFHYPNPFVCQLLQKYYKNKFKLIVYWHLDITKQKILGKIFAKQNVRLLERADKIIATSPNYIEGSRYLTQYNQKCVAIPNCIRPERFELTTEGVDLIQKIKEKYKNKHLCFCVGRHVPYKGYKYLIEASAYLNDDVVICIGGQGPLTNDLKEMAQGNSKINFLGRLTDTELAAYYSACEIICFPSITKNEAFGIALAEGMYFSKPAVTFTIPGSGVNYVNIDKETGIECKNKDVKAYGEALNYLCEHDDVRILYGKNAKQRVEQNFIVKIFREHILEMLAEI